MKKYVLSTLLSALTILFTSSVYASPDLPDLDDEDVRDSVDISAFMTGSDGDVGTLFYIVDRTSNNCFATIKQSSQASGLASISCESLKSIPAIQSYIENGTPE